MYLFNSFNNLFQFIVLLSSKKGLKSALSPSNLQNLYTSKLHDPKYENNQREPKYETLLNIAEIFNVSIDYLLGRTNKR